MIEAIFVGFPQTIKEVFFAMLPLILVFVVFQILWLKLPKNQTIRIFKGFWLTFVGLVLFLQGVNIGFMPVGKYLGEALGKLKYNWILVPIGFVLGFLITLAEPAARILGLEVENATSGYIHNRIMLYFLSTGVATSVALAMFRVLTGISLWYFIVPGYLIVFILTHYVDDTFIGVAFDSGGVATGPMTVTFISALTIGSASVVNGRNILLDGFGMVALVALTSVLAVLVLGFLYNRKEKANERKFRASTSKVQNHCDHC